MKKTLIYIALCVGTLGLQSCRNEFLDTKPTQEISAQAVTETVDNMFLSINGMYRSMYAWQNEQQDQAGHTGMMIKLDALGDDLVFPEIANGWYIDNVNWQGHMNENAMDALFPWRFYYKLIRNANVLINDGEKATGDESLKRNVIGQAYAFRAFSHFLLVQLYAKRYDKNNLNEEGIPLRLVVDDEPLQRSSIKEVYEQINKDLDKAIELLSGSTRKHKSHFDESVVRGIKARVALITQNYAIAVEEAKKARGGFTLMTNEEYKAGFNKLSNREWIWGCEIISDQTAYFANFGAYMSRNFSSSNIRRAPKVVSQSLYEKFPATDVRTQVIDPTGEHKDLELSNIFAKYPYTSQKFLSVSTGDSRLDVPYMRAGEMYLIEAEALARLGEWEKSKTVFTEFTKNRDPKYTTPKPNGEEYINEILDSRRLELWGEGFRFLDLKRLNQPLKRNPNEHKAAVVNSVFDVEAESGRWQFKIPRRELNANPLIKQNK